VYERPDITGAFDAAGAEAADFADTAAPTRESHATYSSEAEQMRRRLNGMPYKAMVTWNKNTVHDY